MAVKGTETDSSKEHLLEIALLEREKDRKHLRAGLLLSPEFDDRPNFALPPPIDRAQHSSDEEAIERLLAISAAEEEERIQRQIADALALSSASHEDLVARNDAEELQRALAASLDDAPFFEEDDELLVAALKASRFDLGPRGISQVAKIFATGDATIGQPRQTVEGRSESKDAATSSRAGSHTSSRVAVAVNITSNMSTTSSHRIAGSAIASTTSSNATSSSLTVAPGSTKKSVNPLVAAKVSTTPRQGDMLRQPSKRRPLSSAGQLAVTSYVRSKEPPNR